MMPRKQSLTLATRETLIGVDHSTLGFSEEIMKAMQLADTFDDIEADEYVLPSKVASEPQSRQEYGLQFDDVAYFRL